MLRHNKYLMIIGIILLATILRLIFLNQSFWLDEAIQATISLKPIFSVNYAADFQPPLFYIFTHIWMLLGIHAEWFLRLPSVIFGILTVALSFYFFRRVFNETVGLVSALLLATAPYHIYYSQEFRMYSFFTFLVLLSWIFLWEKRWNLYVVIICLASFTHYFVFFVVLSQFLYLLIDRRISLHRYIVILTVSFVPFLFWVPTILKQIASSGSLVSIWPKWKEVSNVSFIKFPFLFLAKTTVGMTSPGNKILYGTIVGIVGIIFVFCVWQIICNFKSKISSQSKYLLLNSKYLLLFCYFFIPLLIAWISGLFVAANSPHRLTFVLPAFYAILTVGLSSVIAIRQPAEKQSQTDENRLPRRLRLLAMTSLIIILLFNLFFSFSYLLNSKNHRENWRDAVTYTDNRVGDSGVVLSEFSEPFAPMYWYSKKSVNYIGASTSMHVTNQNISERLNPYILNTKYLILYTYLFEISDPERLVEKYITTNGYNLTEEKDFRGVGIIKMFTKL